MALAVTHVILTIFVLDMIRHHVFNEKSFPRYLLLVGGIAGLLPDVDILVGWFYGIVYQTNVSFHGGITHTLVIPILVLAAAIALHKSENMKWAKIFYVIYFGLFFHMLLDCSFGNPIALLWPALSTSFCPLSPLLNYTAEIDAIILLLWLLHEELHKKIKDYF
jgi:membrane-bound metal-dependent hydrolase YbcI (DUF457 family)